MISSIISSCSSSMYCMYLWCIHTCYTMLWYQTRANAWLASASALLHARRLRACSHYVVNNLWQVWTSELCWSSEHVFCIRGELSQGWGGGKALSGDLRTWEDGCWWTHRFSPWAARSHRNNRGASRSELRHYYCYYYYYYYYCYQYWITIIITMIMIIITTINTIIVRTCCHSLP